MFEKIKKRFLKKKPPPYKLYFVKHQIVPEGAPNEKIFNTLCPVGSIIRLEKRRNYFRLHTDSELLYDEYHLSFPNQGEELERFLKEIPKNEN